MDFEQTSSFQDEKDDLIEKLIALGIYKKEALHLFELTITELEEVYAQAACNQSGLSQG